MEKINWVGNPMAQQKLSVFKVYQNTKRTVKLLSVFDHGYQDGNGLQWKTLSQLPQVLRLLCKNR